MPCCSRSVSRLLFAAAAAAFLDCCAAAAAAQDSSLLTEADFEQQVVAEPHVVALYFRRKTALCKEFDPTWTELSSSLKRLEFRQIDMDKSKEAWALGVKFEVSEGIQI